MRLPACGDRPSSSGECAPRACAAKVRLFCLLILHLKGRAGRKCHIRLKHGHDMPTATSVSHATIANLYFALLGRSPNCMVFELWNQALADGASLIEIARTFLESGEAAGIYKPEMADDEFVKKLYCAAAGRIAHRDTVRHWVGMLDARKNTYGDNARAAVAVELVEMITAAVSLRGYPL